MTSPLQHVLPSVLPLGLALLDPSATWLSPLSNLNILRLILTRFDNNTASDLHEGHPSLTFLVKVMMSEKGVAGLDTPQCMAIAQASKHFYVVFILWVYSWMYLVQRPREHSLEIMSL